MAGIKPTDFNLITPTGTTELYTQTNGVNGKFTVDDIKTYIDDWTQVTVDVTAAQILNSGTPIDLLPAPGVNNYYEYEITMEKDTGSVANTSRGFYVGPEDYTGSIIEGNALNNAFKQVFQFSSNNRVISTNATNPPDNDVYSYGTSENQKIQFFAYLGVNPVSATANLKFKIKYRIKSFG